MSTGSIASGSTGRTPAPTSRGAVAALTLLVLAWSGAPALAGNEGAGVVVTYLANEGFLLEAGETAVLVDALTGDGLRGYPAVPRPLRDDLEAARGRFAGVDLVLASHEHADHFDPAAVARHLTANPGAFFLSTPEAVAQLRDELGEEAERFEMLAALPGEGTGARFELPGLDLEVLNLHHGRGRLVENLGFLVRLGGLVLLHVGDTEATAADIEPYREMLGGVDVALLPSWLLERERWREIGRRGLVVMHLAAPDAPPSWFGPAGSLAAAVASIREGLPEAWVPLEPLASRRYPPATP